VYLSEAAYLNKSAPFEFDGIVNTVDFNDLSEVQNPIDFCYDNINSILTEYGSIIDARIAYESDPANYDEAGNLIPNPTLYNDSIQIPDGFEKLRTATFIDN
jgi:hypothetical protein